MMSSVKTIEITTKQLGKSGDLIGTLPKPTVTSPLNNNNTQNFTSKSNNKFVEFIWSKFTKPKSSCKDRDKEKQVPNTNGITDKKPKSGLFNFFNR